ncbi:helix-turn-helix transcriptional regulator [Caulobacter sp. NIBR2454]|uniref:helix-turn-helix transcriptional regulator n=1 Tax=Caulobacter sp. NIBR2454 TaxID=3015996 RepID=UPI0022B62336|nr:helix-turn-helix transcriptional regulator [Caulobacter sp. NIBR2454]
MQSSVGDQIRNWRQRRRLSQLDLALEAEISTRHLSFMETGRAQPSRDMVLRLAGCLEVPMRERNALLVAAGFAPVFSERNLDDPAMAAARRAVERILEGHAPYPAIAVDRAWNLVSANAAVALLMQVDDPVLLEPPVNVLRLSLHPRGVAPRVINYGEWRAHVLERLRRQIEVSGDQGLVELHDELAAYPAPAPSLHRAPASDFGGVAVPLLIETEAGVLSFISTITVFGTPVDITLSELAIESFFPADAQTAETLRRLHPVSPARGS